MENTTDNDIWDTSNEKLWGKGKCHECRGTGCCGYHDDISSWTDTCDRCGKQTRDSPGLCKTCSGQGWEYYAQSYLNERPEMRWKG